MPLRDFTDPDGVAWRAWDVRPHAPRSASDRRQQIRRDDPPEPHDPERRSGDERRMLLERRGEERLPVNPALQQGWLCFESAAEKRRMVPVPPEWDRLDDAELARLCASAGRVSTRPTP